MKKQKFSLENIIFVTLNVTLMLGIMVVMLYPFINTVAVSFNDGSDTLRGGIHLFPRVFTWKNYESVFLMPSIYTAFTNSVVKTVVVAAFNIFLTAMLGYVLTRREFVFRRFISLVFVLTMYFNAGLIPHYLLIKNLGLLNSFGVYIIPYLISAFNLILIRTYMYTIPESLVESAKIDGAGDFKIFIRIMLPLITPVLATVALFVSVGSWNDWRTTFIYAPTPELTTLQYELMRLLQSSMQQNNASGGLPGTTNLQQLESMVTPTSIRAAITVVAALPILVVYPFLQKYFVTGLNVGGVKE